MADLLEHGASWLAGQRTAHLSRQVTYSRGASEVVVAATVGATTFEIDDGYGVVVKWESRDFLVATLDLVLDGELVEPRRGDRITDGGPSAGSGQAKVYEVMAPGKEDVCRPSDPYGMTLRIHTKQVAL